MTQQKTFFSFKFEEPAPKKRRLPKRLRAAGPPALTVGQILEWADAHHARTGQWPKSDSGRVRENPNENWNNINNALFSGFRGLRGGSSVARLLAAKRGVRNMKGLPPLTVKQILRWADAHRDATGNWPTHQSGPVVDAPGERWLCVDMSLRTGLRSLPGGSSLSRLLAERRGKRNHKDLPALSERQILRWADAHFRRTGQWPSMWSGPVGGAAGENWSAIQVALQHGNRGLAGGSSLPRLLAKKRGYRNQADPPSLSIKQVLAWADAHFRRTGSWPTALSGPVVGADHESWPAINVALKAGSRGLPAGLSVARLLAKYRGKRYHLDLPALSVQKVLAWADAYFCRTGRWPTANSGPVENAGTTWRAIETMLSAGGRGLPGGLTLARVFTMHRGHRNHKYPPYLRVKQILAWADAHFRRTGRWPTALSGPIDGVPHETWSAVDCALRNGARGLPAGMSICRLRKQYGRKSTPRGRK
jgi:hypothetical protein